MKKCGAFEYSGDFLEPKNSRSKFKPSYDTRVTKTELRSLHFPSAKDDR
jgi:hypothetical protein